MAELIITLCIWFGIIAIPVFAIAVFGILAVTACLMSEFVAFVKSAIFNY